MLCLILSSPCASEVLPTRKRWKFDETYIVVYNRYAEETGSQGDTRLIARVVSVLRGTHGLDARWKNDEDGEPYVCVHDIDGWAKLNGVRK